MHAPAESTGTGPLYRTAWRWHFYAGLFTAPLAIFLAITGALYLWKPQYEEWRYRDLLNIPTQSTTVSVDQQFAAACATHPDAKPVTFTPAFRSGRTSETVLRENNSGDKISVFVDPHSGKVLGERRESQRLMTTLHDLHGELLAGKAGSAVVELAASWMFVLLLTGFYLAWPRPRFTAWGFLLPRLRAKGRTFWRDIHAVPAVWFSLGALFLLTSGIPWTNIGGSWFRTVSATLGEGSPREAQASAHRSELTGWSPPLKAGGAEKIEALASTPTAAGERISLQTMMTLAAGRNVPEPYAIALPVGPTGVLSVLSDRHQPFTRTFLHADQYSGRILADVRFADYGLMGKFFLWGIIAHEGQLFGLANQILGTLACLGIIAMAGSGLWLWWQRRPRERFAVSQEGAKLPRPVLYGTLALAVFLPLLATSLVVVWLTERFAAKPASAG